MYNDNHTIYLNNTDKGHQNIKQLITRQPIICFMLESNPVPSV